MATLIRRIKSVCAQRLAPCAHQGSRCGQQGTATPSGGAQPPPTDLRALVLQERGQLVGAHDVIRGRKGDCRQLPQLLWAQRFEVRVHALSAIQAAAVPAAWAPTPVALAEGFQCSLLPHLLHNIHEAGSLRSFFPKAIRGRCDQRPDQSPDRFRPRSTASSRSEGPRTSATTTSVPPPPPPTPTLMSAAPSWGASRSRHPIRSTRRLSCSSGQRE